MKTRVSKPLLNQQIIDEASAWFVEFRVGDVDQVTRERFDEWLRRSPEHIRAYIEIAKTYVILPALDPGRKVDVPQLIAHARADGNVVALGQPPSRSAALGAQARLEVRSTREGSAAARSRWLSAACMVVLLASAISWAILHRYPNYATDIGQRQSITLPDGSTVDLNARSSIRVQFLKSRREVDLLAGQAFFEVAKDKTRPFIVQSGELRVQAVGTQFDVDRHSDITTVTVVEGRVAVITPESKPTREVTIGRERPQMHTTPAGHLDLLGTPLRDSLSVLVSAGEQVVATGGAVAQPTRANLGAATAWLQHRFIFDRSRLSDVVDDFNRYNRRPIVIIDPELDDFHISGVYSSTDPASLIRFLRTQPDIRITESDDSIRIERK
ncbi:MAG TPA: FecR domain-containing protein [Steroidobacteraceae bacterium]|nr:FecR domain-containing protein [Steroidobacteraceae bacterium]